MPVPTSITSLSTTAASNDPSGSGQKSEGDDHLRALYSLLRQNVGVASDLTAASSVTIPANYGAAGLTGTTTVTAFASTNSWAGRVFLVIHKASHTFTHSSTLYCPGGASKAFVNGDKSWWVDRDGAGTWECVAFLGATTQLAAMTATTGSFSSTLSVTGATTLSSTLGVTGVSTFSDTVNLQTATTLAAAYGAQAAFACGMSGSIHRFFIGDGSGYSFRISSRNGSSTTDRYTFSDTGNATISGTLGVTSDLAVNTDKFNVAAASGNTAVAGTLAVTGATTLSAALNHASRSMGNSNYTLVLDDAGRTLYSAATTTAKTVTIPPNSDVAFPIGTRIFLVLSNKTGSTPATGHTTVARGTGVALSASDSITDSDKTASGAVWLVKCGTDSWFLSVNAT